MDREVFDAIDAEKKRQTEGIELIASENYVSEEVLTAAGSILTNKYVEVEPSDSGGVPESKTVLVGEGQKELPSTGPSDFIFWVFGPPALIFGYIYWKRSRKDLKDTIKQGH